MTIEGLKTYWNQWNDRERGLVVIAGICCLLYICYAVIYSPLASAVEQAKVQLTEDQSTLQWMRKVRQQHINTQVPQLLGNGQLLSALGNELNHSSFHQYAYQLEQTGTGDIQLAFEQVPYNLFVVWLKKLSKHYAFSIKQLTVEQTKTSGVVKILVVISAT